jgi:hypothetical protein
MVRWEVRNRMIGLPQEWSWPVTLRSSFSPPGMPQSPVARVSALTFNAPDEPMSGTFTLETRCGQKSVDYRRETSPSILALNKEEASPGKALRISGHHFGAQRGGSQAALSIGAQSFAMSVDRWADDAVDVRIPNNAPRGDGNVRIIKGGRLASNARPLKVLGSFTVNDALIQLVADGLGLGSTQIRLQRGANASSVMFSAGMRGAGASDLMFTVPEFVRAVPQGWVAPAGMLLAAGTIPKRYRYRVKNVNSNSVTLHLEGGQLVLRVGFEDAGSEIQGELETCFGFGATCEWLDGPAPDLQVNNARVTASVGLSVHSGAVTVASMRTAFDADISAPHGLPEAVLRELADFNRNTLKSDLATRINSALNTPAIHRAIGRALMAQLNQNGVQRVVSLSLAGNSLTVEFE